jgi:VanZ family protein
MEKFLKNWLPAILLCILIFAASSTPGAKVSDDFAVDFGVHKAVHLFLYSALFFCFYRGAKNIPIAALLAIMYGVTDEFHQTFVPSRQGSAFDVLVDAFAVLISAFVLWKYSHKLPNKLLSWLRQ